MRGDLLLRSPDVRALCLGTRINFIIIFKCTLLHSKNNEKLLLS
jgi:hypothetical protein